MMEKSACLHSTSSVGKISHRTVSEVRDPILPDVVQLLTLLRIIQWFDSYLKAHSKDVFHYAQIQTQQ